MMKCQLCLTATVHWFEGHRGMHTIDMQGSPRHGLECGLVGGVWVGLVTTSTDYLIIAGKDTTENTL